MRERLTAGVLLLIVFSPLLLTFFYVSSLSVEVPWSDDWDIFVPPFYHQAAGTLHWTDINAQHNEALVAIPVATSLILARVSGGRMLAVTYLSYSFLSASLVVLFLFFRMLRLPGAWSVLWFLPASFLFLGWRQSEALLWATHLVNTMALFFSLACLYACTRAARPGFFFAAMVCAWIASFSMASGILVWFPGVIAVGFSARLRRLVLWLLSASVCVVCFLADRAPSEVDWDTGISYAMANAADAVKYAFTYVGGPLGATPSQSLWMGIVLSLIAFPIVSLALRKTRADGFPASLLLVVYPATALACLLDRRLGIGVDQAFDSRYVTLSALLPIGIYFCSLKLAGTVRFGRYLAAATIVLMTYGIVNSYSAGWVEGRHERDVRTKCAAAVKDFRNVDPQRLECAYPDSGAVLERAALLERYHLSLFEALDTYSDIALYITFSAASHQSIRRTSHLPPDHAADHRSHRRWPIEIG